MTIAVFVFSLLGAMALGMPIAYALLVCGVALMGYLALIGGLPAFDSQIIAQRFVDGADNFPLLAVPFFLLAGEFMTAGGLSRRIVNMAMAWVGHFRGGMGYVAVVAAIIMASISGSAVADTAALAALLIPMMKAAGYQVNRSAGLIAAGGIIGGGLDDGNGIAYHRPVVPLPDLLRDTSVVLVEVRPRQYTRIRGDEVLNDPHLVHHGTGRKGSLDDGVIQ